MTESQGLEGPGEEVAVDAATEEKIPAWAWWLLGLALASIAFFVAFAISTATPEEKAPLPEPSVTASASPSPSPSPSVSPSVSPSPSAEPSDSPTPMPSPTDVPSEEPSDTPTPMPSPTDVPTPPSSFGQGKIVVGKDAAAGTYRVDAPVTAGCVWALKAAGTDRLRDLFSDVIVGGIPTITLIDGDTFASARCGTWSAVDPAGLFQNANADVAAKPGVWLVGEDIKAGTWQTGDLGATDDPAKLCTWKVTTSIKNNWTTTVERKVIFSGTGKVVLEKGQQFESTHCGEWTLLTK